MAGSMTDVTGYRHDAMADGGALMRAVAPQLEHVLTGKSPLLNGPGMVMENSLYYDITSSTVTAVELQETFQKDRIACSVQQPGAANTCYIPSVLFANTIYLCITLPYDDSSMLWPTPDADDYYFYMPDGWGFYYIQSIILYLGACNISQIEISGESNFLINMAQAETKSKRQVMMSHAGRYLNSLDLRSVLAPKSTGLNIFRYRNRGYVANNLMYSANMAPSGTPNMQDIAGPDKPYPPLACALVPIRTPWSSMVALEKRISFDTKLVTQPIQLTFNMRNQATVIKTNCPGLLDKFAKFKSLTVQLWQQELSDKSLSLRGELLRAPDFNVGYPFQYAQSVSFPIPSVTSGYSPWDPQNFVLMNINSLINSDLTTMLWYVNGNYQRSQVSATALKVGATVGSFVTNGATYSYIGSDYCPMYGIELQNMELKLNGQRFYAFDYDTYSAATMAKQIDDESCVIQRPQICQTADIDGTDAGSRKSIAYFPSDSKNVGLPAMNSYLLNTHYYELNFGKLRSIVLEAHMQNTGRFTNQTFQFTFQIGDIWACQQQPGFDQNSVLGYVGSGSTATVSPFTLYMTYLYNAVILAGGDGGTTKLITN